MLNGLAALGVPEALAAFAPEVPPAATGGGGKNGLKKGRGGGAAELPVAAPCEAPAAVEGSPGAGNPAISPPAPPRIMFDICSIIRSDSGFELGIAEQNGG